jgi:hypothetical protein
MFQGHSGAPVLVEAYVCLQSLDSHNSVSPIVCKTIGTPSVHTAVSKGSEAIFGHCSHGTA